jgi:hypothetical protein
VARDRILPVPPPPTPFVRPPTPPVDPKQMLGQPAGWIPPVMPKPFDPMIAVGDAERVVHAVPSGTQAMCGYQSASGWQWARGFDVTCQQCCRKIMEDEFERDSIVQHLRKLGHEGPITREDYISFNYAGLSLKDWGFEHEADLPLLQQCWDKSEWPWPQRRSRRRNKEA